MCGWGANIVERSDFIVPWSYYNFCLFLNLSCFLIAHSIYYNRMSKRFRFEEVFKEWIKYYEDSMKQGLKKQGFFVGMIKWRFFYIVDTPKSHVHDWTFKVQILILKNI